MLSMYTVLKCYCPIPFCVPLSITSSSTRWFHVFVFRSVGEVHLWADIFPCQYLHFSSKPLGFIILSISVDCLFLPTTSLRSPLFSFSLVLWYSILWVVAAYNLLESRWCSFLSVVLVNFYNRNTNTSLL